MRAHHAHNWPITGLETVKSHTQSCLSVPRSSGDHQRWIQPCGHEGACHKRSTLGQHSGCSYWQCCRNRGYPVQSVTCDVLLSWWLLIHPMSVLLTVCKLVFISEPTGASMKIIRVRGKTPCHHVMPRVAFNQYQQFTMYTKSTIEFFFKKILELNIQ